MAVRIIMPKLGDFMTEGIVTFVKSKGDSVNQGEVILEIESEKLNYELEAAANGVFHTVVSDGTTVPVDDLIGYLLDSGEEPPVEESKAVSENISASPKRSESKTFSFPVLLPKTDLRAKKMKITMIRSIILIISNIIYFLVLLQNI